MWDAGTRRTIRDTVRHTEVNVEQTPGAVGDKFDDSDFRADFQKRYAASGAPYDTYLPAYRYGYDMASDPHYVMTKSSLIFNRNTGGDIPRAPGRR
jgi:hypothetical protein